MFWLPARFWSRIAIWLGTSGEPPLRVGDAGIAVEKGGLRRMPWYAVERIEWRDMAVQNFRQGHELGAPMNITIPTESHGTAAAWVVREARARIPRAVDVPEDVALPNTSTSDGETVRLEPTQVVGKHCAASGKIIAFEPDARVCPRCERVYHRAHVPGTCECGATLTTLQMQPSAD